MPAWWDSLDTVTNVTWWLRWIGASLTILGALCVVATLATSKRVEKLKEKRDAFKQEEAAKAEKALRTRLEAAEERQRPRSLTAEQRQLLLEALSKYPARGPVIVSCFDKVFDSCSFGFELREALEKAGWTPARIRTLGMVHPEPPLGLVVSVRRGEKPPEHAGNLQHALRSIKLLVGGDFDPFLDEGYIGLKVGSRP